MGSRTRKRRSKHLPGVHLLAGEIQPGQRVLRYSPARLEELQGAWRVEFFHLRGVSGGVGCEVKWVGVPLLRFLPSSPLRRLAWHRLHEQHLFGTRRK